MLETEASNGGIKYVPWGMTWSVSLICVCFCVRTKTRTKTFYLHMLQCKSLFKIHAHTFRPCVCSGEYEFIWDESHIPAWAMYLGFADEFQRRRGK
jgi:hypothetical protein